MDTPQKKSGISRRSFLKGMATASAGALVAPYTPRLSVASQAEVNLRWSMWSATPEETAVWQALADSVTKAYPNIKVKLETSAFNDYWGKLQTQLSSQTEPDIIAMQSLRMPGFAARKALRPLKPLIDKDPDVKFEDFFKVIEDGMSYNGEVYGFAYDLGPIILYYNKDLFDAAKAPTPSATEPMSWEAFSEVCKQLTKADDGQYGYAFQPGINTAIPWLWSAGGDYMDADAKLCTLDSPESLEALEYIVGLIAKDKTARPITDLANSNFASESFYSGKVAMVQNGPWNFVNVRKNAKFNWDIAPLPAGKKGSVTWVAGSGFGLSNTTKFPDEAWKALKVITSTESLMATAKAGRGYPGRQSSVSAFKVPDAPPKNVDAVEQILAKNARFLRTTTTWQEIEVMLTQTFNPVFLGQQSVKDTITQVKPKFDELLKKHQEIIGAAK
jgi:multiple sugar transport system substrate-binding protein